MEIRQLKYFIGVVNSGSLSRAALKLFVAQSALSKQIAALEMEVGAKLLDRTAAGISLTESGRVFHEYAQGVLKQLSDAKLAVRHAADSVVGTVVLGIPQSIAPALSLAILIAVRERLPGITLQMNDELPGNIIEHLRQGRLDLAVLTDNICMPEFLTQRILKEEFSHVQSAKSCIGPAPEKDISFAAALKGPLVISGVEHGHCMRAVIEAAADAASLEIGTVSLQVNSMQVLRNAVLAGLGASIVPAAAVASELRQGLIVARRIVHPVLTRTLVLTASQNIPLTNAKRAVAKLIVELIRELREEDAWDGTEPVVEDGPILPAEAQIGAAEPAVIARAR